MVRSRGRVAVNASGEPDARGLVVVLDALRPMPAADVTRLKRGHGVPLPGRAVEVCVGRVAP